MRYYFLSRTYESGIFDKMTYSKKVKFIERVHNTILGLDGLQIIVDADNMLENSEKNQFAA